MSNKPQIVASNRQMRDVVEDAWASLVDANEPPVIFRRGGLIADVVQNDLGDPQIRNVDKRMLKARLARVANFISVDANGTKQAQPPSYILDDMMVATNPPLPLLKGIIHAPIYSAEGVISTEPAYQPETGYFYHPAKNLHVPQVPVEPSAADIAQAKVLIFSELMVDFPFVEDADAAHAAAIMIQPFVRPMINGPTPLYIIESPLPGTGKDLLAEAANIPALGWAFASMTEGEGEGEWRKRITAQLLQGKQIVVIGNLRSRLDSAALSAALTLPIWEDRVLGVSQIAAIPISCMWLATGNNPSLSLEIARRTVSIRIDAGVEKPWQRADFKHPDLRSWAMENRGELI